MGALLSWLPGPFGQDRTLRVGRGQLLAAARIGWLGEAETVLGSSADGGFGRLSADTLVSGFELQFETWSLTAEAELGWTLAEYRGGIISEFLELTSTFFLLATRRLSESDESIFSLKPPRLEQGLAALSLPTGRTKGGGSYIGRSRTHPVGKTARSDG